MKDISFLYPRGKNMKISSMYNCLLVLSWIAFSWPDGRSFPEMMPVKGGPFYPGDSLGDADEGPVRRVTLRDFYMAKTETTLAQFDTFVKATGYRTDAERGAGSYVWTPLGWNQKAGVDWRCDEKGVWRPAGLDYYPVMHVSWNDAARYCNWLSEKQGFRPVYTFFPDSVAADLSAGGYRLPTEAEWEYAARGGPFWQNEPYRFAGSDLLAQVGWYNENSGGETHDVGLLLPNALDLYDMSGNVWEWCADNWHDNYRGAPADGKAWPGGNEELAVLRGGSWILNDLNCRVARRYGDVRNVRFNGSGFRLARGG